MELAGRPPSAQCTRNFAGVAAIKIDTLRKVHEYGYALAVYCRPCNRSAWVALAALIAAGRAIH
jgi:hypothetical protein